MENQDKQSVEKGHESIPEVLSKVQIIENFEELIKADDAVQRRLEVKNWKAQFEEQTEEERTAQENAFNAKEEKEKGENFEFQTNPLDNRWKELYNIFQDKWQAHKKAKAEEEKENLSKKEQLVEELKQLVEDEMKNVGAAFAKFYEIQDRWNAIGAVNKSRFKQLQYDYSHYRDLFYHNVNIYDQLKNYDFEKNAALKKAIIAELKTLIGEKHIKKMERGVKDLQARWDEVGPTSNEVWEELKTEYWSQVNGIYDIIRDHYKSMREAQAKVLEEKNNLIQKIEELVIQSASFKSAKDWIQSNEVLNDLHKEWKAVGYAARSKEEQIWEKFKALSDELRQRQNDFFTELKKENQVIVEAKEKLIQQAESMKDSKEWKKTADTLIKFQKEWKRLGHVAYKKDQELWNRFRRACDDFFDARKNFYDSKGDREADNFKQKEEVVKQIAAAKSEEELREYIKAWQAIDYVPKNKMASAESSFNQAVKVAGKSLQLDEDYLSKLMFEEKVAAMKEDEQADAKLKAERQFIQTKIDKLGEEILRFEENLAFFGPSKGAQKLKEVVDSKIELAANQLEELKAKLKLLR